MTPDRETSFTDMADIAVELDELRRTADDIVRQLWSVPRTRALLGDPTPAYDESLWQSVREVGWPDVLVDQRYGGGGGGLRALCVLAEASGAIALPVPLAAAAAAGWCEQRCVTGVPLVLPDGGARLAAGTVRGQWPQVAFGGAADRLIVLARQDGEPVLGVVDAGGPGVVRELQRPLDHTPAAGISLQDAPLREIYSGAQAVERHAQAANRERIAVIAELIGIASAANAAAVDYAKIRVTFGQPIGARQAIKHRLVDGRAAIEVARALVNRAADAAESGHPDADVLGALAAFWAVDSLRGVVEGATQVFGGIAYTWEHDAHVHLRRAAVRAATLGARSQHRAVVAQWLASR
ncbi:acyl-CoA dehydrogenase family protein [Mycobacterium sp. UM_Kg1]|uniref:acyl-CoA dehydrogenase family protein n=1 Tax=Mycobacterium sp. UM_Kg1 TaxID=1545691 RepID=UPI00061B5882|nr:acyl-CoA dehydrogenase family protein [Mycobacterium sp. UM_Kg1]